MLSARASGSGVVAAFRCEAGGHRWQRIPPTERRGRVHTSTVTVAVLPERNEQLATLDPKDVTTERYKGGKGGQHQNKHANNVRLTHRPTGLTVQVEGRLYHKNRESAWRQLQAKWQAHLQSATQAKTAADVAAQVGTGMRGDKTVTIALQRDSAIHHETGKKTTATRYMKGHIDDLHR